MRWHRRPPGCSPRGCEKSSCSVRPKPGISSSMSASNLFDTATCSRQKGAFVMPRNVQHARPARRQLSIVVPLFNEAGTIDELHRRLTEVLHVLGLSSELIYVDDGSTDGTTDALTAIAALDPSVRPIILALASWGGARIAEVPISNIPRPQNKSHYGLSRTWRVMADLITVRFLLRYVTRPLHLFGPIGFGSVAAGTIAGLWIAAAKLLT